MRKAGYDVGRDHVARLMMILGIEGVRRGKHRTVTSRRDPHAAQHPDLIGRAWDTPTRPDQWWAADSTYVWTLEGFVYTSFVTDVCLRRILGWRVSASKTTPLVMSALDQALFTRRRHDARFTSKGLVHHSDAGSPVGTRRSASPKRPSTPGSLLPTAASATLDNALIESAISLYKTELIEHPDRTPHRVLPRHQHGAGSQESAGRRAGSQVAEDLVDPVADFVRLNILARRPQRTVGDRL